MAQLDTNPVSPGRKRPGTGRLKKPFPRIDMTPMVDLGFLLISFFVITTELTRSRAMPLIMPKDTRTNQMELGESYALTVLLTGDKHFYYEGSWEKAYRENRIHETSITGLREIITRKQKLLDDTLTYHEGRKGLMLLIKAADNASYNSIVDAMDEAIICTVDKYALIGISSAEKEWLRQRKETESRLGIRADQ